MNAGRVSGGLSPNMIGAIAVIAMLSISFLGPSLSNTGYEDQSVEDQFTQDMTQEYVPPSDTPAEAIGDGGSDPAPTGWVDGDFIISSDEETINHAVKPSVAVTPVNEATHSKGWDGSIHVVWDELDEVTGNREIHYSMTTREMSGYPLEWTGETEDRIVSEVRQGKAGTDNAINASICVDDFGNLHVIWAQQYPDSTWEIHYSRSENNGKDWTSDTVPDIVISGRQKAGEATTPPDPKVAVGRNPNGKAPENALYVAWTENYYNEVQEVHFSRSLNGGNNWTGSDPEFGDQVLSNTQFANNPSIAATGNGGEIVNVAWGQYLEGDPGKSEEIYFVRSFDYGTDKTWEPEIYISDPESHPVPMNIGNVEMVRGLNDLHIVWDQAPRGGKAFLSGIFYSFMDGNEWRTKEVQIDKSDENAPSAPTIGTYPQSGGKASVPAVQVTWSELNDQSEIKTMEIHTSFSSDPIKPDSWTGQKEDIVLSWPDNDPEVWTNATNPSMGMRQTGSSTWSPTFVWDEMNNPRTKGFGRGQPNTEIHFLPPSYTIAASSSTHGSINPSGDVTVNEGDDQTFTFTPDSHYHISDVVVDGGSEGTPSSYKFTNVVADHTISVTFAIDYHTLTTSVLPTGKGTVSRNPNAGSYAYGTVVTLTANPIVGWHFTSWSGHMSGSTNPDSIIMNSDKTVTANFAIDTFIITASAGTGGTIAPSGAVSVNYGDDQGFVINPSAGYAIKDVLVDSVSVGATSTYTFTSVITTHTIEAQFIPEYTKSLSAGWNRISFPLIQADTTITTVLSSLNPQWTEARYYDASGTWKTYTNGVGGTLTDVNHTMGIWVHLSSADTFIVTGERPASTEIVLKAGWNMIGYPAEDDSTYDIADLKADVLAVQLVYKEDWRYQMTELGDSYILQNGELYWVFVNSDTTWTVDW